MRCSVTNGREHGAGAPWTGSRFHPSVRGPAVHTCVPKCVGVLGLPSPGGLHRRNSQTRGSGATRVPAGLVPPGGSEGGSVQASLLGLQASSLQPCWDRRPPRQPRLGPSPAYTEVGAAVRDSGLQASQGRSPLGVN